MSVQARRVRPPRPRSMDAFDVEWEASEDRQGVVTLEAALYVGAAALGVLLRLLLLDARPLATEEGSLAAESFRIWQGNPPAALTQGPLTAFGTALMLGMFGTTDGAARLLSVLFGSVLVISPYLLRRSLGRMPALLAAYLLAVSPLMLFASRDVGSGVVPLALGVLLWWALDSGLKAAGQWRAYGAAALVAGLVASGTEGVTVLLALALAATLSHPQIGALGAELRQTVGSPVWRRAALAFVAVALTLGTGLGTNLSGVQWVVVDGWAGWARSLSLSAPRATLLGFLALYELPVVLLALAQLGRTVLRRERVDTFLSLWAMLLLLMGMLQEGSLAPHMILPAFPIYLLAARLLGDSLSAAVGVERTWRWAVACAAAVVPLMLLGAGLTWASSSTAPVPTEYLLVEAMLVVLAVASVALLVRGRARLAVGWWVAAVATAWYLLHGTFFLNYRLETMPREPLAAIQVSPFLRDAAVDAEYFSNYFNARVTVDPQWRPAMDWYLRRARDVQYSAEPATGISFQRVRPEDSKLDSGSERRPGLYTPQVDPKDVTWQQIWRWIVFRNGLVRPVQRDVVIRAPVGSW